MKKALNFLYPFSGFNDLSFINCFTSAYMYFEGITGVDEFACAAKEGKPCNGCGNCNQSTQKKQEDYYFLFDTLSGRSSVRPNFGWPNPCGDKDFENAPDTVDFVFKIAGYEYSTATTELREKVQQSIDEGKPVLARLKDGANGVFRVIIGYDGESTMMAEPNGAQNKPSDSPTYDQIAELIVFGKKTEPLPLIQGLRRIEEVMSKNLDKDIWGTYIKQFKYWDSGLKDADFAQIKDRFKIISNISWYDFNCHNFAETFRHRITEELKDPRLDGIVRQIDQSYDNSHTRNWQIISLFDCRNWSERKYNELEWGYCTCVVDCLEKLRTYDEEVLIAIRQAIQIIEKDDLNKTDTDVTVEIA